MENELENSITWQNPEPATDLRVMGKSEPTVCSAVKREFQDSVTGVHGNTISQCPFPPCLSEACPGRLEWSSVQGVPTTPTPALSATRRRPTPGWAPQGQERRKGYPVRGHLQHGTSSEVPVRRIPSSPGLQGGWSAGRQLCVNSAG